MRWQREIGNEIFLVPSREIYFIQASGNYIGDDNHSEIPVGNSYYPKVRGLLGI
jgi:hypothetical protein